MALLTAAAAVVVGVIAARKLGLVWGLALFGAIFCVGVYTLG